MRSNGRRSERERQSHTSPATDAPPQKLAREEARDAVADAVASLREPYHSAVTLRYFMGMSAAEIAVATDTSVETVRTRLKRATKLLREDLKDRLGEDPKVWLTLLPFVRGPSWTASSMGIKSRGMALLLTTVLLVVGCVVSWFSREADRPHRSPLMTGRATGPPGLAVSTALRPERNQPEEHIGTVTGRVLQSGSGHPGRGLIVTANCRSSGKRIAALTDASGEFTLADAMSGEWDVRVERNGRVVARAAAVRLSRQQRRIDDILFDTEQRATGLVLDEQGRPIADARVRVHGRSDPARTAAADLLWLLEGPTASSPLFQAATAPDGSFVFPEDLSGELLFVIRAEGYQEVADSRTLGEDRLLGSPLRFELTRCSTIAGQVVDSNGHPIRNCRISIVRGRFGYWDPRCTQGSTTDDDGRFSLTAPASDQPQAVVVHLGPERGLLFEYMRLPATLTLRVATHSQTSTILLGAGRTPLPRTPFLVGEVFHGQDVQRRTFGRTDQSARFPFASNSGPASFIAHLPCGALASIRSTGAQPDNEIVLPRPVTLRGRFLVSYAATIPTLTVVLLGDPGVIDHTVCDAAGAFAMTYCGDQPNAVLATTIGGACASWPLVGNGTKNLDLRLSQARAMTGRVVDGAGGGIRGARVHVVTAVDAAAGCLRSRQAHTDRTGAFTLDISPLDQSAQVCVEVDGHHPVVTELRDVGPGTPADFGTITVDAARILSLQVQDDRGLPLGGAEIQVFEQVFSQGTTPGWRWLGAWFTNHEGRVSVPSSRTRKFLVTASAPHRAGAAVVTRASDARPARALSMTLDEPRVISGTVRYARGTPAVGIAVVMRERCKDGRHGPVLERITSRAGGTFSFDTAPAGRDVEILAGDGQGRRALVTRRAPAPDVELTLEGAGGATLESDR